MIGVTRDYRRSCHAWILSHVCKLNDCGTPPQTLMKPLWHYLACNVHFAFHESKSYSKGIMHTRSPPPKRHHSHFFLQDKGVGRATVFKDDA